jgi:hypothetical protein
VKPIGTRIWKGDPNAVAEVRQKFQQDRGRYLIQMAMALYSFRHIGRFAEELLSLRQDLIVRGRHILGIVSQGGAMTELVNTMDMIATYLAWMSRREELDQNKRREAHELALNLALRGLNYAKGMEPSHHTPSLLRLTAAGLSFEEGNQIRGDALLRAVGKDVALIADRRQRARILRQLGLLHRRWVRWMPGLRWSIKACMVKGVPLAVRAKSVAALFGISR